MNEFNGEHVSLKKHRLHEKWVLPWEEFEVALGVKNIYLLRNLNINSKDKATQFLLDCGFDLNNDIHSREIHRIYGEAVYFIRHVLFAERERETYHFPSSLIHLEDISNLLVYASSRSPRRRYLRLWSCAILKIMFVIGNLEFSGKLKDLDIARDIIFSKIRGLMEYENEQSINIRFNNHSIKLAKVEWKEAKSRNSIILKLLHKPDSIVDEVFDYLGVRLVVNTQNTIPYLIKLLIDSNVIIPHQVVGVRTRNTLLNIKLAKKLINFSMDLMSSGIIEADEFQKMCENVPWSIDSEEMQKRKNHFSSDHYRSVQFTVRHLVRSPNPSFRLVDSLIKQLSRYRSLEKQEPWIENIIPSHTSRFFPLEVQIMDTVSYETARFGPASHELYKAHQLNSVRERILSGILHYSKEKLASQIF